MKSARGLKTRLCPKCGKLAPHRTLYAKTESGAGTKWFQMFWACTRCDSPNHLILPTSGINTRVRPVQILASMNTCACGWTLISPLGAEDVKKHTMIHLKDSHPGITMSDDEVMQHIKTV